MPWLQGFGFQVGKEFRSEARASSLSFRGQKRGTLGSEACKGFLQLRKKLGPRRQCSREVGWLHNFLEPALQHSSTTLAGVTRSVACRPGSLGTMGAGLSCNDEPGCWRLGQSQGSLGTC